MDRDEFNKRQKQRRAELKEKGLCVDCGYEPVQPQELGKPPHACCGFCLQARRSRWKSGGAMPQLPFEGSLQV